MKAYLEMEEVRRLEEAAIFLRHKLLIRFLVYLACRIFEALSLAVKDVDLAQGTVTILHLKERIRLACPTVEHGWGGVTPSALAAGQRSKALWPVSRRRADRRRCP